MTPEELKELTKLLKQNGYHVSCESLTYGLFNITKNKQVKQTI